MKSVQIKCPSCSHECLLSLEGEVEMILLNCQSCDSPLLHMHGETIEVDEVEMKDMALDKMEAVEAVFSVEKELSPYQKALPKPIKVLHKKGQATIDHNINGEDITDLIIDIETAEDVSSFIDRM